MSYQPGNLLREYSIQPVSSDVELVGVFLVISATSSGVTVVSLYDSDECWRPTTKLHLSYNDLKDRRFSKWEVR
jgi:hypothetical protein